MVDDGISGPALGLATAILDGLKAPVVAFASPTKRLFWGYLVGAAVLASLVWALHLRRRCSLLAFLFPRRVWLHPSALLDYRLMFARAVLHAVLLAPFTISTVALTLAVARWLWSNVGILPDLGLGRTHVVALFSVSAFVAQDFARYLVHRLAHQIAPLWELHKVHHSAEVLTPFTVYRTHPLESVLMRGGAAFAVGLVGGILLWIFPGRLGGWAILGVDAAAFLWNLVGSNLRHSHVRLSYGRWLEHVFISPAQHQIHHGSTPAQFHSNFGSTLAIWDWLGRTLKVAGGREPLTFGLPASMRNHKDSVASALLAPLWAAGGHLLRPIRRLLSR